MSQKIVYLDQFAWIYLARAYFGKTQDLDEIRLCNMVIKASESEDVIFPLSYSHLVETRKIKDTNKRERLLEFMSNVSKGHTILPFSYTMDAEIRSAILKRRGFHTINIKDFVVRKGFSHMFGCKSKIKGNIPENAKKEMIEWLDSSDAFKNFLKRLGYHSDENLYINTIKKLEDERSWYSEQVKDKNRRKDFVMARNMMSILTPKIAEICIELHIYTPIFKNRTEKDILDFIKDIPTFYIPFILAYYSENDLTKSITINDVFDITHLTTAIPYCDIVVADNVFVGLAKQHRLDKDYPTTNILSWRTFKSSRSFSG